MNKNKLLKKGLVLGIIVLFVGASVVPNIIGLQVESSYQVSTDVADVCESQENVVVTCYTFGFPGEPSQEMAMSLNETEFLYNKIKDLQIEISRDPLSNKTQQLQHEIIILADEHNLLPAGLSQDTLQLCLYPSWAIHGRRLVSFPLLPSRGSELFCTFVSTGSGALLPIIALPRLIPILMTPIPRLFVWWRAQEAITSCGGLRSETGFIAYGQQKGIALGFWGIGFTFSLPPFMGVYGLIGFALFASVNAERIEYYPPNYPPEINAVYPLDGAKNIPVLTSELSFKLDDPEDDFMSYSVTTEPDIGAGNGHLKPNGVYTVPVSGLEGLTEYTWYVEVNDGNNWVDTSFTFTTEAVAPIVSDPSPPDGARNVPMPFTQLSFHLRDPQGDLMDYTVETSPDIGSGSGTGVGDGTYNVDVSGLDYSTEYIWHVDVTDGTHWTKKIFSFTTEEAPFNPFDEGWHYRKQITINHTKVNGDLTNFPVLISTIDSDLCDKAQDDGDDILFMEESGVSRKLFHEIENYDGLSGKLATWVDITSLSSTKNTTVWVYYGNPYCSNQQNIMDVWDSDYMMVQHLQETSGVHYDSTSNNMDGNPIGVSQDSSGIIDGADYFDGANDYIDVLDSSDLEYDTMTISVWVKKDSLCGATEERSIVGKHQSGQKAGYLLEDFRDEGWAFYVGYNVPGGPVRITAGETYNTSIFYHVVGVYDNGDMELYVNGYSKASDTVTGMTSVGVNVNIGRICSTSHWHGVIDEVRISKSVRSSTWISTEYNNQNDPLGFLNFGPEETGP